METKTPLQKVNRSQLIKLSHARSESGQAVVEYLLVLVITVAIAVGLLYQFNGSFARWATSYFGSYFACLLETGELPGIGGAGGDSGICSQLYENFSFAGGVPPSPRIGSGGSGGGRNRPQSPRPTPASEGSIDSRRSSSGGANYARVGGQNARRSGGGSGASTYGAQMGNSSKSSRTKLASKPTYTGSTESSL
ncbi:MAG: hypothetical protein KDD35_10925, partial [Bdellovibrionales bacterium]|nr:hypothetical protein [Bdellovibrionales bacterium]